MHPTLLRSRASLHWLVDPARRLLRRAAARRQWEPGAAAPATEAPVTAVRGPGAGHAGASRAGQEAFQVITADLA